MAPNYNDLLLFGELGFNRTTKNIVRFNYYKDQSYLKQQLMIGPNIINNFNEIIDKQIELGYDLICWLDAVDNRNGKWTPITIQVTCKLDTSLMIYKGKGKNRKKVLPKILDHLGLETAECNYVPCSPYYLITIAIPMYNEIATFIIDLWE